MNFTRVNGVVLHYSAVGAASKPALVFANSLGTDFRTWDVVVEAIGHDFRVVCYDKRGHGLSEAPPAPYAISDHIGDLAGLLDLLQVRGALVVGLSVGGLIAQGLAAAHSDRVRALVLCDTAHKIGTQDMWDQRIATIRDGGIEALAEPILERWFSAKFRAERPAEFAGWRNMLTRTPVEGYVGTCAAIRDADLTQSTKALRLPTICVVGTEDGATPPALVRSLADLIPGARYSEIHGVGHLPCIEAPDILAKTIADFAREAGLVR